jgi:endonuclease YncB( thermonuclease family)
MRLALFLLLLATSPGVAAADPSGRLTVKDGDTFDVGGVTVRLFGIDAPELDQTCATAAGAAYPCGEWAATQTAALFDGASVTCQTMDIDRYGRTVARCFAGDQDIAATLVASGIALAYRDYSWDYDLHEKSAQVAGLGLWSGSFDLPADWRAADRSAQTTPQPATGACIIKGNISASGRIYHQPHNRDYADTRIDESRGERWFCTPDEAEAAGWRAARN